MFQMTSPRSLKASKFFMNKTPFRRTLSRWDAEPRTALLHVNFKFGDHQQ
jgi:hypothetical protein